MPRKPDHKPAGYHTVTPFVIVEDVKGFLDFAGRAFGAETKDSMAGPDGSIVHAEVSIGDSMLMVGPVMPDQHPLPAHLYLYVPDVDATYARAVEAGATSISKPTDEFWGDRASAVTDRFGNTFWIATHVEEVSREEMQRRSDAAMGTGAPSS